MITATRTFVPAWAVGLGLGACFSSPSGNECSAGSEGCECLELQCENGLECRSGFCRAPTGGTGATGTGGDDTDAGTTTGSGGETTAGGNDTTGGSTGSGSTGGGLTTGGVGTTTGDSVTTGGSGTGATGTTGGSRCGDGVIDDDEMCDGGLGCTDCVLDNWNCNPINNVPCQPGTKCAVVGDEFEVQCLPFDPDPPLMWGEVNCFYDFGPHDEACDLGLACTPSSLTETCEAGTGSCCTEFCDIRDPGVTCITPTDSCEPFWSGNPPDGLDWLGYCVTG